MKMKGFDIMKKESIKESIRKLLVKAGDSGATLAEKDEAYLMAQRLMLKHKIDKGELDEKTSAQKRLEEIYHKPVTDYITLNFWHRGLARIISKNFKCLHYIDYWQGAWNSKDANKKRLMMFGIVEDVEIAADVYESAFKAIETHSKDYINSREDVPKHLRTGVKNDFIQGYLDGLAAKFEDQVAKYQLVIAVNALVKKEHDDMGFGKARAATRSSAHDAHATTSGYIKGRSFASGELIK
jgi:hypothetical protein